MLTEPKQSTSGASPDVTEVGAADCADGGPSRATSERPAKPRKKRSPPPTFDDGATTRLFKFPSRTHPKSSYYITNTDIIIRVKKARKRWKLVLPKRRVVSYRTNRWFAKPRWVEVELTYTQALKYGFVQPKPAGSEAVPTVDHPTADTAVGGREADMMRFSAPMDEVSVDAASAPPAMSDNGELHADVAGPALGPTEEADGEATLEPDDYTLDFSAEPDADTEDGDAFEEEAEPAASSTDVASSLQSLSQTFAREAAEDEDVQPDATRVSGGALSAPDSERQHVHSHASRRAAIVVVTLALLSAAGTWTLFANFDAGAPATRTTAVAQEQATPPSAAPQEAARNESLEPEHGTVASTDAATSIATASVAPMTASAGGAPSSAAKEVQDLAAPERQDAPAPSPSDLKATTGTPQLSERAEMHSDAPMVVASQVVEAAPAGFDVRCRDTAKAIIDADAIRFDYASASLPLSSFKTLDQLALHLRSCPRLDITIAGHTDSDGHVDRNQRLSIRRAEAVRQALVDAGIDARQLTAIGAGQLHPLAPNDTDINKRKNRRIEIAVR